MWRTATLLVAVACSALATGLLIYLADRASAPPALIAPFAWGAAAPLFGVFGQWLPSFVHPFAFALLTAAARPRSARPAYDACAGWWAVNVLFEAGQRFHLFHGTFDPGDIAAATLGALAAAAVIRAAHSLEGQHAI